MNNFFRRYFKGDPIIWTIYLLLCVVSIVAVFSASSDAISGSGRAAGQILRHVAFIAVGFGTLLADAVRGRHVDVARTHRLELGDRTHEGAAGVYHLSS